MRRGVAEAQTALVDHPRVEHQPKRIEQTGGEGSATVAGRAGRGGKGDREERLQLRRQANAESRAHVPQEEIAGSALNRGPPREGDLVEEGVTWPFPPFGNVDPEQPVVPVEEAVEEAVVGSADVGVELEKGAAVEIPRHTEAQPEDLRIENVARRGKLVVLDGVGIIQRKRG